MKKRKVGFIGAGKVGTALAARLFRGGYPVIAVADTNLRAAEKLADLVPGCSSLCQQLLCCSIDGSHGSISEF